MLNPNSLDTICASLSFAANSSILDCITDAVRFLITTISVQAGIKVEEQNMLYNISGKQQYLANNYFVEGDYSNAAFIESFFMLYFILSVL